MAIYEENAPVLRDSSHKGVLLEYRTASIAAANIFMYSKKCWQEATVCINHITAIKNLLLLFSLGHQSTMSVPWCHHMTTIPMQRA